MKIYSATEAAVELGIDPRALRRFLRNDASYRNVGMGGRYMFTPPELRSLKRAYAAHLKTHPSTPKIVDGDDPHLLDDDKGVPLSALGPKGLTPSLRAQRAQARALRQQRLLTRMDAVLAPRTDNELEIGK